MAELVDALDLKSGFFGSAGSNPALGIKLRFYMTKLHRDEPDIPEDVETKKKWIDDV